MAVVKAQSYKRERQIYTSKEGIPFDVWAPRWQLSVSVSFSIGRIDDYLPQEQAEVFRRVVAQRANTLQASTVTTSTSNFLRFLKRYVEDPEVGITIDSLLNLFSSSLKNDTDIKSDVKLLLEQAISQGYEAHFELGFTDYLSMLSAGKRDGRYSAEKREETRAFTEYERTQFIYQLSRADHLNLLSSHQYLILKLLFIAGKRPIQLKNTKIGDFFNEMMDIGGQLRNLVIWRCPVAKQVGAGFRSEFNDIPFSSELELQHDIERAAKVSIENVEAFFNLRLNAEQRKQVPLFASLKNCNPVRRAMLLSEELDDVLKGNLLHDLNLSNVLFPCLSNSEIFAIRSERTGQILKVFPRRLRHTYATALALSGATEAEIANALDQSSIWSVRNYTNNLPKLAIKIGQQLESTLGVLAKRFDCTQEIVVDAEKIIKHYTKHDVEDVGMCGRESFCQEDYPYACYICELFVPNPWGNHKVVLDDIEEKMAKAIEYGDQRMIENWRVIQIGILERKFLSDQVRIKMLKEIPDVSPLSHLKTEA